MTLRQMVTRLRARSSKLAQLAFAAGVAAVAMSVAAGVAACGVGADSSPRSAELDFSQSPQSAQPQSGAAAELAAATGSQLDVQANYWATLYFDNAIDRQFLLSVIRPTVEPPTPLTVLQALLAGPTGSEFQNGIRTNLPSYDEVLSATVDADSNTFIIDFAPGTSLLELPGREVYLAMGQLVLSLTHPNNSPQGDIESVSVLIDGEPQVLPTKLGNTFGPVSREHYTRLELLSIPSNNSDPEPQPPGVFGVERPNDLFDDFFSDLPSNTIDRGPDTTDTTDAPDTSDTPGDNLNFDNAPPTPGDLNELLEALGITPDSDAP